MGRGACWVPIMSTRQARVRFGVWYRNWYIFVRRVHSVVEFVMGIARHRVVKGPVLGVMGVTRVVPGSWFMLAMAPCCSGAGAGSAAPAVLTGSGAMLGGFPTSLALLGIPWLFALASAMVSCWCEVNGESLETSMDVR